MTTDFATLAGYKHCRLVTFRRSGTPVPTPMWFAVEGERVYLKTEDPSGKVKRIRNDPRVELAPCTIAGRPLGPAITGQARLLEPAETAIAERVLRQRYGIGRRLFALLVEPLLERRGGLPVYLEVTGR